MCVGVCVCTASLSVLLDSCRDEYSFSPSSSPSPQGYFMLPTVITGVKDDSRLMNEEIFGESQM